MLSKRAKVQSDKPAYKEKKKTDKGYVWIYDEKHVEKRWKEKKEKLKKLEKELDKVRKQYREDLKSDDDRTKAIAAIVGIMDETAMRIGNEESAREGTYGASTLKVKHVKGGSGKMTFDFPGKGAVEQNVVLKNNEVIKAIRDLMKGKKSDDFIFEIDGKKIWDRAVNRYLKPFDISAKDLRGFHANRLMKDMLKKKDFKDALDEVAEIVGHKASTLKNQYLDPELVEKHEGKDKDKKDKRAFSIRAQSYMEDEELPAEQLKHTPSPPVDISAPVTDPSRWENYAHQVDVNKNVGNVYKSAELTPSIKRAWRILAPFMPEGTYLSSAYRGPGEQARILIEYWRSYAGKPGAWRKNQGVYHKTFSEELGITDRTLRVLYWKAINDKEFGQREKRLLNRMVDYIRHKSPKGVQVPDIAYVGKSEHQEGMAFDITGSNLKKINQALMEVAARFPNSIQILSSLVEPANNAVHVVLGSSVTMPPMKDFVAALYQKQQPRMVKRQSLSVRAELAPEDLKEVEKMKAKLLSVRQPQVAPGKLVSNLTDMTKEEKRENRIAPGAKTTDLLNAAWKTFAPFLPKGAVLTSGFRSASGQLKTLNNYYRRATGRNLPDHLRDESPEAIRKNFRQLRQISRMLDRNYNIVVGPPVPPEMYKAKYGHGRGNAMDISGADLDAIARAVRFVSRHPDLPVKIKGLLIERNNNAVHVNVERATYDPQAIAAVKQQVGYRLASEQNREFAINAIYDDLLNSNASKEAIDEFRKVFGFAAEDFGDSLNDESMGFGIDDEMGDWFEKSPIFRHMDDEDFDYDIHDVSENEAKQLAKDDPDAFFYRGLHKECPEEEPVALKNMLEDNAKFYFVFKYHEREEDEFKELLEDAAEALSQQDARAFFYYHLHHKFPELGRGAIVQLIDTNPDSFFDLGLDKDYPDYIESANNARNIKDPNKVELEQPEWLSNEPNKPISLRDKNAAETSEKEVNKMSKGQAAYKMAKGSLYACNECEHWIPGANYGIWNTHPDQKSKPEGEWPEGLCMLHEKNEEISANGTCKFWKKGEPVPNREPEGWGKTNKKASWYRENEYFTGFKCNRCRYYVKGGTCEIVEGDIEPEASCALWRVQYGEKIPLEASSPLMQISSRHKIKRFSKRDDKKNKDRKHGAGVFIVLPKDMSKQFPSLGEHDNSVTHVTVLYIGDVPENKQETVYGVVRDVIKDFSPLKLKLDDKPSYFPATKHSDGCKIAKMKVECKELHKLHKALKRALTDAGVDVDDHFPVYKPHVTLEYMEPPKEKYDGEVPSGSWTASHVQVWSCGAKKRIPFGKQKISSREDRALSARG